MWSTRQMVNRGDDRELFQRSTVRELAIYCCFLVVLIAITFGTTSSVMFYYTQVMGGLFIKAKDVDNVESFWEVCCYLLKSSAVKYRRSAPATNNCTTTSNIRIDPENQGILKKSYE